MGRHSRKGPATTGPGTDDRATAAAPGGGRRRRVPREAEGDAREHRTAPPAPPETPAAPPCRIPRDPAPQQYGYAHDLGTPPHGTPVHEPSHDVRGGHPEQREPGGAWGDGPHAPAGRPGPRIAQSPPRAPGPRREFVEAFDGPQGPPAAGGPKAPAADATGAAAPGGRHGDGDRRDGGDGPRDGDGSRDGDGRDGGAPAAGRTGRGRTVTGIAAAAVISVLAVVVTGQVGDARQRDRADRAVDASDRGVPGDAASRSEQRDTPPQPGPSRPTAPAGPATYEQLMARQFPFDPAMKGSGEFEAVPGTDEAPGKGRKVRYRVDVEKGLGLDGELFARAVQETLNDERSWAHGGAMTFERISTGRPDFVITLASPGTTGVWCAKSGLDTTVDNVSCDSAATDRVMINAYRWARGAETFGPGAMLAYRQMLINHEVGHRLGHNHRTCQTPGAPAPVMQQQTKSLEIGGVKCRPNPWAYPGD
ncbi:DUF3152 domain-containing protein [Streptomyces sudanensis]|uniref:DUF3152 domain-containing protein n=1 Tax=Streptomyces sudanensis TaxID=436397 RepID=UPI0020CD6B57|nr:DUF3152 domain-containing protein [Streptomyces sudanensis]MCP9957433.1 DUF3152 domain-containing protein [Streptomyces sudanensis]